MGLTTVFQLYPYYSYAAGRNLAELTTVPQKLETAIKTNKVWLLDSRNTSVLQFNAPLFSQMLSLQGYTNFNLPSLYKFINHVQEVPLNASGIYIAFPNAPHTLQQDNDFISMMGVKYILAAETEDLTQYRSIERGTVQETLLEQEHVSLTNADSYQIAGWPVQLEESGYYHINITIDSPVDNAQFYADFAAENYDLPAQETWFALKKGSHRYQAIIPAGSTPPSDPVAFRIVIPTMDPVTVSAVKLEQFEPVLKDLYVPFSEDEDYRVFENKNAKELVFPVKQVIPITEEEKEDLYISTHEYDILNTSYITNGEAPFDFSKANVTVNDIVLKNNSVTAQVQSDKPTFINMSQNYYPGWRAYVDGKRTKLYEVNGIIQGMFVPEGAHQVKFLYVPMLFYIGILVAIVTILLMVWGSRRQTRKLRTTAPKA